MYHPTRAIRLYYTLAHYFFFCGEGNLKKLQKKRIALQIGQRSHGTLCERQEEEQAA